MLSSFISKYPALANVLKYTGEICPFDKINMLMGRDKIRLASQGFNKRLRLKQERLSPCYTTQFSDILTIYI